MRSFCRQAVGATAEAFHMHSITTIQLEPRTVPYYFAFIYVQRIHIRQAWGRYSSHRDRTQKLKI
jgi:hypothetical protein